MKRRRVPNTISKRMRRKLRRAKNPFLLWLRLRRPEVYARLERLWWVRFWERLTSISPMDTPFFSSAPKVAAEGIIHEWAID